MEQIWLFPTVVSISTFPDHALLAPRFNARIRELIGQTGKTQTSDRLHEDPEFLPLVEFIIAAVTERFAYFKYAQTDFFITGCWANIHLRGQGIGWHRHPNSYLSGVYYSEAPQPCSELLFNDPRKAELVFDVATSEGTQWNSPVYPFAPTAGVMLLFPSWLEHNVPLNPGDKERISIAFNVMLQGELGRSSHLSRVTL
jgi:uncharacterized protein (TIGR02466 family)